MAASADNIAMPSPSASAPPAPATTPPRESGNDGASTRDDPSWLGSIKLALGDIKIAHSVFALPFAVLAVFIARPVGDAWRRTIEQIVLVVVCMVLARTWAMLVNRLADRRIDAKNPRTRKRVIADGRLSARRAMVFAGVAGGLFVGACALFRVRFENPWPLMLAIPVLGWVAFYSFTKRFTSLCHVFLGGALAISPLAAAVAVDPSALERLPALWWLAGMVLLWVAGFDVIYALQDFEFDLSQRLHSIPSTLGPRGAIWVSRLLHVGAFVMLMQAARSDDRFGVIFASATALVGLLLVSEHVVLAKQGKAGLHMAFFTINGAVSCLLGLAGVMDVLIHAGTS